MIISVKTIPKSKKQEIIKISDTEFRIYLKKPAIENKANKELEKLLREYFSQDIKIVRGRQSRNKIIQVGDI